MSAETAIVMSIAMGRTLVLPPEQGMYLLEKQKHDDKAKKQKHKFTFTDFYHLFSVEKEHTGLDIISTKDFLEKEVMSGKIKSQRNPNQIMFPPKNITDFNGSELGGKDITDLGLWLRQLALTPKWNSDECIAIFPDGPPKPEDGENNNRVLRR